MTQLVNKSHRIVQKAAGRPDREDLKEEMGIVGRIKEMLLIVRGSQVSTAGGAISGFGRTAPWILIKNIEISGHYLPRAEIRTIVNADPTRLYWLAAFLNNHPGRLLTTSAGASATDPIQGVIPDFLTDNSQPFAGATYIDARNYTSINIIIDWADDADLATTNLSDVTGLEVEVQVVEEVGADMGPADEAHFEPSVIFKEHPSTTLNTKLTNDKLVSWDGLAITACFFQHDDSAAGDAELVDGLVKRFTLSHGGHAVFEDIDWSAVLRKSQKQYPLAYTTTVRAGTAAVKLEPPMDSRDGDAGVRRDTRTTAPAEITAVTPAAADSFITMLLVAEPNKAMQERLEAAVAA